MKYFILAGLLLTGQISYAIQEIEVTVSDESFNSSNKVVIPESEIKKSYVDSFPTLLSAEANIAISASNFTPSSIYIRGGDSSHVLFLVDGIPTYDPSTLERTMNLSLLNLRAIKKIEILKGSQSVLYGGQALSGVIKIETYSPEIKNETDAIVQGGYNNLAGSFASQYKLSDTQALMTSMKGINAYDPSPAKDSKKYYPEQLGTVELSYLNRFQPKLETIFKVDYTNQHQDITTLNYKTALALDTDDFHTTDETTNVSAILRSPDLFSLSYSHQYSKRTYEQDAVHDNAGLGATDEKYDGVLDTARLEVTPFDNQTLRIDTGLSFSNEGLVYRSYTVEKANQFRQYEGAFVKGTLKITPDLVFEGGYRKEMQEATSIADTAQVGLSFADTVKFTHATGFKTPSLFQLYGYTGNPDLKPEKATTEELSFESQINPEIHNALTFFESHYDNLIAPGPGYPSKYLNVGAAFIKGFEYYISYDKKDLGTHVQISLGYEEPKDLTRRDWLLKRPMRTASLKANQKILDKANIGIEVIHVGSRTDGVYTFGPADYVTLPAYTLLHLVGSYEIQKDLAIFTRIENVVNQTYQPTYGYFEHGPVARFGLNYSVD